MTTSKKGKGTAKKRATRPEPTQPQPGTVAPVDPSTQAIHDASKVAVGTDVAGTPQAEKQAAPVGGLNAPGANVDDLNTDPNGGVTLNDAPEAKGKRNAGRDDDGNPIVKDRSVDSQA